jgi:hypothetical protein
MHKITGKQCKTARSLLKWNVNDLSSRLRSVPAKRIESFERGIVHIQEWENDEIVKAMRKEGVEFRSDFEVILKAKVTEVAPDTHAGGGDGARIVLDGEQNVLSDSSANVGLPGAPMTAVTLKEIKEKQSDGKN